MRIVVLQLPFPSLSYFPSESYFRKLEGWYQKAAGLECRVPTVGIWEAPPWITWLSAAIKASTTGSSAQVELEVLDLSAIPFGLDAVLEHISTRERGDVYLLSPLLQNTGLAGLVARELRAQGARVLAGGPMAKHLDPAQYDSIFLGRIEAEPTVFAAWLSGALRIKHELQLTTESFGSALDYRWATGRYEAQAIYLRTFSHHGCPLSCTFCADRLSGSWAVPPGLLEQDLTALHEAFPSRSVLYVGDLTFGVSLAAVKNLSEALNNVQLRAGKAFKLIVQTNASLINRSFVSRLRDLGVVVVEMGIESGDSEAVRRTEKRRPSNEWLEEKIDMIHEAGLRVAGNIVVGLPRDSDSEYTATEEFILKWRSKLWFNVYGFVPYPGTPLYAQLLDERRIVTWDLSKWCEGAPLVFEPYGITADRVHDWLIRMLGHVAKAS